MSVESSVYTRQPALSPTKLRELGEGRGLAIRFLDIDGKPLGVDANAQLDEPMDGAGYVLIGWPAADAETTGAVERALRAGDKPAIDRLGMAGTLGWCSVFCGAFDLAEYEDCLMSDWEDDEEGPPPAELLERMKPIRTEYAFRCGTRPAHCGDFLGKIADLVRDATGGIADA